MNWEDIETKEQAKRCIAVTATTYFMNLDEVLDYYIFQNLADKFGFDLGSIKQKLVEETESFSYHMYSFD